MGLPGFLVYDSKKEGLNNGKSIPCLLIPSHIFFIGFMISHYTAAALGMHMYILIQCDYLTWHFVAFCSVGKQSLDASFNCWLYHYFRRIRGPRLNGDLCRKEGADRCWTCWEWYAIKVYHFIPLLLCSSCYWVTGSLSGFGLSPKGTKWKGETNRAFTEWHTNKSVRVGPQTCKVCN